MTSQRAIIIGAGVGGLVAGLLLAARGVEVDVIEAAAEPGGKMSRTRIGDRALDAGPTVFTMRWVFDAILDAVGERLDAHLALRPLQVLARHAWSATERFDLPADRGAAIAAVGDFAGAAEARRYAGFCEAARAVHDAVADTFIRGARPGRMSLPYRIGLAGGAAMLKHRAFSTLWAALGHHFHDQRLRQLFARYATYCGSSPFLAPAILMLVAHVESEGVWSVDGGMHAVARMLAGLLEARGGRIRYGATVAEIVTSGGRAAGVVLSSGERLAAEAIVANCDVGAIAAGLFGQGAAGAADPVPMAARSLSALTFSLLARTRGFPLSRHNVFFCRDYAAEFDDIFGRRQLPGRPTVYVCAEDRDAEGRLPAHIDGQPERLFCLVNAPAAGDSHRFEETEIESCRERTFGLLQRCGLETAAEPENLVISTPADFHRRFPGTGGALYGRANHDLSASFRRPGARTRLPGLYLAGGSVHPGPGVPMAALSGRQAAASLLQDFGSILRSSRAAIAGGISTPSATTEPRG